MRPLRETELLLLERFSDGEASGPELNEALRLLEEEESAREYVASLDELRQFARAPIAQATAAVDFDALALRIGAALDAEEQVVAPVVAAPAAPVSRGFVGAFFEMIGGRSLVVGTLVGFAVAAAVLLTQGGSSTTPATPEAPAAPGSVATQAAPGSNRIHSSRYHEERAAQEAASNSTVRVENGYVATIVEGNREEGTVPVVWVESADDSEGSGQFPFGSSL